METVGGLLFKLGYLYTDYEIDTDRYPAIDFTNKDLSCYVKDIWNYPVKIMDIRGFEYKIISSGNYVIYVYNSINKNIRIVLSNNEYGVGEVTFKLKHKSTHIKKQYEIAKKAYDKEIRTEAIHNIISKNSNIDDITYGMYLDDIKDEDMINIISEIEDHFGIELNDDTWTVISDIIRDVNKLC